MCKAMDEIEADARAEGVSQGISQGKGLRENEIITDMLSRGKSIDEIVEFCNFSYEQVEKVAGNMD